MTVVLCIVQERSTQMQIHCLACHALEEDSEDHECVLAMTESWMPSWTSEELVSHQRQDPDLKQVIAWLETRSIPKVFPTNTSSEIKALWAQCDHLIMKNNNMAGCPVNKRLQLVFPSKLVPVVLKGLHSSLVGGHMWAKKTQSALSFLLGGAEERYYQVVC